jgi:hypothetical protein
MDWGDVYAEAILLCVLTMISEIAGLAKLFELVNPYMKNLHFDRGRVTTVNNSFGANFSKLVEKTKALLSRYGLARRPSLNEVDNSFGQEVERIQVIPFLIYANIIKTEGCPEILEICDECFASSDFELATCGLQIIPPGESIPVHRFFYNGFYTYFVVIQGNQESIMEVGGNSHLMMTKASIMFESNVPSGVKNNGKTDLILLGCGISKPMDNLGTLLGSIVLKIISYSKQIAQACENGWIR